MTETTTPTPGLRFRCPADGPLRAVVITVDAVTEADGRTYVTGHNALGQHFQRELGRERTRGT